ncbi:CAMK protein kinase [Magnaporthiopsis poae ATCC 64411]|uniref:CAMK protein kinase n=1 Tax=Magnaporthiopsis poae (strain ATCC 64411 / 73-15) TaxID=644358 RepID=A0A0C4EDG4_MAGP6|nr:CAMK protein kinase [Magnaporthiopsis poae ATCC 64411]
MADPDLIARLYAFGKSSKGWKWADKVVDKLNPMLAGPSPLPPASPAGHNDPPKYLELRFGQGTRTGLGFVLGKDPATSDIVLVDETGISERHCAITFENDFRDTNHYRLVVRDLETTCGTSVSYSGKAGREDGGIRRGFRWIIGGHDVPAKKEIVIELHDHLQFRIDVPKHDIKSEPYIGNVARFHQGRSSVDDLFGQMDVSSLPRTEAPSGARTPGSGDIEVEEKLGEGGFGVVTYVWNVSDGDEYAFKEPSKKAIRERRFNEAALLGALFTQSPRLIFEYVPGGALSDHEDISAVEGVQILKQCLSALAYLYGHCPPILHRDVKPENTLVQYRRANDICVKLGDFGLAKESHDPTTFCGSPHYAAPELWSDPRPSSYTPVVDIWSLGVTVFGCVYDLPSGHAGGTSWCESIVEKLKRELNRDPDDGLKQFLRDNMVVMDKRRRRRLHAHTIPAVMFHLALASTAFGGCLPASQDAQGNLHRL